MHALGRLLTTIVRNTDDSQPARECAVFTAWNTAAGAAVRRVCAPERLDNRQLFVSTVDANWKKQLESLASELIFKINSLAGAPLVARINFRVDPASVERYNEPLVEPLKLPDATPFVAALEHDAEVIDDPELRELFLRTASRCLARSGGESER